MVRAAAVLVLCLTLQSPAKSVNAGDIDVVRAKVLAWAKAWESRDIKHYMSFYAPAFRSKGLDRQGWKKLKSQAFKKSGNIRVDISDLWVFIEKNQANVSFVQRYYDQNILDVGQKNLFFAKTNGTWEITFEEWKPLTTPAEQDQKKTATKSLDQSDLGDQKVLLPDQEPERQDSQSVMLVPPLQSKTASENFEKHDTSPQPDPGPAIEDHPEEKNVVNSVTFKIESHSEKVFLSLNRFTIPRILTLEGDRPRIVIDVVNVSFWNGPSKIAVNGKLIRQIRTHLHRDIKKLRIVLDLNPADDYMIDQTFYKKDTIYCIEVR